MAWASTNTAENYGNLALTFDDILLVPGCSSALSSNVGLRTRLVRDIYSSIPVMSADMGSLERRESFPAPAFRSFLQSKNVLYQLRGGLRFGMGYVGAENLAAWRERSRYVCITNAGLQESHPHSVTNTWEAPNYQVR